jgi:hypothetical protein
VSDPTDEPTDDYTISVTSELERIEERKAIRQASRERLEQRRKAITVEGTDNYPSYQICPVCTGHIKDGECPLGCTTKYPDAELGPRGITAVWPSVTVSREELIAQGYGRPTDEELGLGSMTPNSEIAQVGRVILSEAELVALLGMPTATIHSIWHQEDGSVQIMLYHGSMPWVREGNEVPIVSLVFDSAMFCKGVFHELPTSPKNEVEPKA